VIYGIRREKPMRTESRGRVDKDGKIWKIDYDMTKEVFI